MTPEERQQRIESILASQDTSINGLRRLAIQYWKIRVADHRKFMAEIEAERQIRRAEHDSLMAAHDSLMASHEIFMAQHEAVLAEYRDERERRKQLEGRVNGIEELTKFLRELFEGTLRRPEKPPETEN